MRGREGWGSGFLNDKYDYPQPQPATLGLSLYLDMITKLGEGDVRRGDVMGRDEGRGGEVLTCLNSPMT